MSKLNSKQIKLAYGIGIILLLGPVVYLGFPASQTPGGDRSGGLGVLSQMRQQYDLGEATLGKVDPSSAAMNLVLLGLRGPAASVLHLKAIEYQERKQWAKLRTTVDSIILLQPHYVQIWKFQGWNLAYNVSREWDKVDDRFYWVKEGIKFLIVGTERNQSVPILFHDVGEFVSSKMGISDEKKFFREFFEKDPDPKFETAPGVAGPDPITNPEGKDSYLVAYDWFVKANDKDDNDGVDGVEGMTHVFFRQGPARALMSYAQTRAEKGLFDEHIAAFDRAYKEWMDVYGKMKFSGLYNHKYVLNSTEDELKQLAEENGIPLNEQRRIWAQNLDMTNYRYWRDFANIERDPLMLEARRSLFLAKKAYNEGRGFDRVAADGSLEVSDAEKHLNDAQKQWAELQQKYSHMFYDGDYVDQCMLAVQYWLAVHQQNSREVPKEYPLKALWDANENSRPDAERTFLMETRNRKVGQ